MSKFWHRALTIWCHDRPTIDQFMGNNASFRNTWYWSYIWPSTGRIIFWVGECYRFFFFLNFSIIGNISGISVHFWCCGMEKLGFLVFWRFLGAFEDFWEFLENFNSINPSTFLLMGERFFSIFGKKSDYLGTQLEG
jgi:hypothetical protein